MENSTHRSQGLQPTNKELKFRCPPFLVIQSSITSIHYEETQFVDRVCQHGHQKHLRRQQHC